MAPGTVQQAQLRSRVVDTQCDATGHDGPHGTTANDGSRGPAAHDAGATGGIVVVALQ